MERERIVFANGVFDLRHPGHDQLLLEASRLGDTLIVGINSDSSTKLLKGEGRPIQSEDVRKAALEALPYVDLVIVYKELRPTRLIRELMPDVVVKGGEYDIEHIRTTDDIPTGIEIVTFPIVTDEEGQKLSTTAQIAQRAAS